MPEDTRDKAKHVVAMLTAVTSALETTANLTTTETTTLSDAMLSKIDQAERVIVKLKQLVSKPYLEKYMDTHAAVTRVAGECVNRKAQAVEAAVASVP